MRLAPGKYRVSYTLPVNLASGHVEIVTVGENGKKIKLNKRREAYHAKKNEQSA